MVIPLLQKLCGGVPELNLNWEIIIFNDDDDDDDDDNFDDDDEKPPSKEDGEEGDGCGENPGQGNHQAGNSHCDDDENFDENYDDDGDNDDDVDENYDDDDDDGDDDDHEMQFAEGQFCTLIGLLSSFAESCRVLKWRIRHLVSIWLLSIFSIFNF